MTRSLAGRRVVVTRPEPGSLGAALAAAGADVAHVPLIAVEPAPADGPLGRALTALGTFDWLVVTSANGARAVGVAAADHPSVRLAAVGRATAAVLGALSGRAVELVPSRERVEGLLEAFGPGGGRVLVAQADRAAATLADGLRELGYAVTPVVAYRTVLRNPSREELDSLARADVVVLASGSAVESLLAAGVGAAAITGAVVTIGPKTAAAARAHGFAVAAVAATPADADVVAAAASAASRPDLGA
jgi:uroporphyrinogen-III synthase